MPAVIKLTCPGCGAPVDTGEKNCKYCDRPIMITSFASARDLTLPILKKYTASCQNALKIDEKNEEILFSMGMAFLRLKLYDKAKDIFEKLIDINCTNADNYFYAAISTLGGKKPFTLSRKTVDKACEYLDAAIAINENAAYLFLLAYIKYDYFFRKKFRTDPAYEQILARANEVGLSAYDKDQIAEIIGIELPEILTQGDSHG